MKLVPMAMALAALLIASPNFISAAHAQQQPPIPDAPTPQALPPLTGANGTPITPGRGDVDAPPTGTSSSATSNPQPGTNQPPASPARDTVQTTPPELPAAGEGVTKDTTLIHIHVNYVEVPVTVKDSKGKLVAGLTYRDFRIFENNSREPISFFTVDAFPLSIVFVVDQSLTSDVMKKVNESLGAIQGALTAYDELSVFSYSNGPQDRSHGFTGGQSAHVPFALDAAKSAGTEMLVPVNSGPLAGCPIHVNGNCADPTIQPGFSTGAGGGVMTIPKEIHTLNDAILAAAKELSTRPTGRRRIIYVISDGKENGSTAKYKEVVRYLQTNKIAVYGTLVGDSARWGEGFVSRIHLPFTMYDNRLYGYAASTGGTLDAEPSLNGIEKSYQHIAEEARNQYTLGYYTHEPFIDGKYRKIDVRVDQPGLEIIAKPGYYPSAQDSR
ncbi:MAG: VWA domain-containing protein [Terracidiphilus sp.]